MKDISAKLLETMKLIDPEANESDAEIVLKQGSEVILPTILMLKAMLLMLSKMGVLKEIAELQMELYNAYVKVGFTRNESIELIKGVSQNFSAKK